MDKKVYENTLVHHDQLNLKNLGAKIYQQHYDPNHAAKSNFGYLMARMGHYLNELSVLISLTRSYRNLWQQLDIQIRKRSNKLRSADELDT